MPKKKMPKGKPKKKPAKKRSVDLESKSTTKYDTEAAYRFNFGYNNWVEISRKRATNLDETAESVVFRSINRGFTGKDGKESYRWNINFPGDYTWDEFKVWLKEFIDKI